MTFFTTNKIKLLVINKIRKKFSITCFQLFASQNRHVSPTKLEESTVLAEDNRQRSVVTNYLIKKNKVPNTMFIVKLLS